MKNYLKVGDNYVHMQFKETKGRLINRLPHYLCHSGDQNRTLNTVATQ